MENKLRKIFWSVILIGLFQSMVNSKPMTNSLDKTSAWIINSIRAANGGSKTNLEQSSPEHAFIKFDTLKGQTALTGDGSIVITGDSSMRLFNHTEITHPNFDPAHFLNLARNDSVQSVEIQPVSDLPYFMFIPPELLKDHAFERLLFGNVNKRRRRIKRHHPSTTVQNVLGELQNYALVPIKSNNGQIRYILLKNPKFVISNPSNNGGTVSQQAPTIIQLNSQAATTAGKIQYPPRTQVDPVTQQPFRRVPSGRRQAPVPFATPIDSIFNTQSSQITRSNTVIEKIKSSKTTKRKLTAGKTVPYIPSTWEKLRRNYVTKTQMNNPNNVKTVSSNQGFQNDLKSNKISGNSFVGMNSGLIGGRRTIPLSGINTNLQKEKRTNTLTNNKVSPRSNGANKNNIAPNTELLILTGGTNLNKGITMNSSPVSGSIKTLNGGTNTKYITSIDASPVNSQKISANKINSGSGLKQMPVGQSKVTSIQKKSKSVVGDRIKSSASSIKETANGLKASVADATLEKLKGNETNVNQTNSKNITITKVGDHHKIEQTEIVETVVDVKKNETATKTATAASKVVSSIHGHGHTDGSHIHDHIGHKSHVDHGVYSGPGNHDATNTVSANAGAAEKATAEKQAQVIKKTKKTTTILLKSGSETKSGKAEISEIQHTVEELVHHNTSEKAGAETAATANVDTKTAADPHTVHAHSHHDHGHTHAHAHDVPPVKSEKSAIAEAKKETNSTSTSVKTKSVKQTVIKKKVPDPNKPVSSNSTSQAKATTGKAVDPAAGFDVQHVEHVVQETEHKVQQDKSQISKHKADQHTAHAHSHHDHGHVHAHAHDVPPATNEKAAIAEAKKETNSTSTSVKTKSVKQTVIQKKAPDPILPASNSTSMATETALNPVAGFDVKHVEHLVQETEHTVHQDKSQVSKHKAKSFAEPGHNHRHH